MSIVFYYAPMSSASPVLAALAELNVPHERVTLNLASGDQRKPEFLAINPNGKVPTIVIDGQPMFEALAIMQCLGERFGVAKGLWPAADSPERLEAMAWSTWAYVTYGTVVVRLQFSSSERMGAEYHNAAQADAARKDLQHLLSLLEARLSRRPFMLGQQFTLADVIVSGVVGYSQFFGTSLEAHPHVKAWLESCQSRPSYQLGIKGKP